MTDTLENRYAVIFSAVLGDNLSGYDESLQEVRRLAAEQEGYLGMESLTEGQKEITVSYWRDLDSIKAWKDHPRHRAAQKRGRSTWYRYYDIKIVKILRQYDSRK